MGGSLQARASRDQLAGFLLQTAETDSVIYHRIKFLEIIMLVAHGIDQKTGAPVCEKEQEREA